MDNSILQIIKRRILVIYIITDLYGFESWYILYIDLPDHVDVLRSFILNYVLYVRNVSKLIDTLFI